ncbi:chemotaxis protein CheW [Bordetella genomosp. 11]|uniref:Chemotaxis protein CheW n=1 Tax=Bordetella genomosp. 11 TaxID=1416808 RepID=A0A261UI73_9BORD|nr:chemotaxis protein CheW [Bordetella genomosp. 11]OZI61614.1 hypothetical protein CAL28_20245 [Bordetella genomosp. 11]
MHERDDTAVDDCWNRIGVRGDRSCPRLDEYIHCRQCPVHATAAKSLLNRVTPGVDAAAEATIAVRADATRSAAMSAGAMPASDIAGAALPGPALADGATSLLLFRLHAEWLALPVAALAEVTPMRPVHSLPRRAGIVAGVCNVRGRLIPCISLAPLLNLAPPPDTPEGKATPRMLVLSLHTGTVVAPVDDVAGIQSFASSAIGPLPDTLAGARYASGVVRYRERAVGVLDSTRLGRAIEGRLA